MSGKRKGNYFPYCISNNINVHTGAYTASNAIAYGVTYIHNNINTITDNIKHIVTKYLFIIINLFIIITYEWRRTMLYTYILCVLAC
jgi:hypothetical protein